MEKVLKNVLFNSHIMNNRKADKIALVGLDERSLIYDYQFSNSTTKRFVQHSKVYNESFSPFKLIHFDYKGIEFNMITCPAGGKVDITNWGEQEIDEPFMLGETEVTQELFEAVMGFNYSKFKKNNKNPVENVTWFDCLEFCNRLSGYFDLSHCYMLSDKEFSDNDYYPLSIEKAMIELIEGANGFRLPKEWEWQIAAMAGTNNLYAGANDNKSLKRFAWFDENSDKKTHPVAQKLPNEWGFYDMSGNVWEWCESSDEPDESSDEPGENDDPLANRVGRGGDSGDNAMNLPSQMNNPPNTRSDILGFRVARSIHSPVLMGL